MANSPYPRASEDRTLKSWQTEERKPHRDQPSDHCAGCGKRLGANRIYIAEEGAAKSVANTRHGNDSYFCGDRCLGQTLLGVDAEGELSKYKFALSRVHEDLDAATARSAECDRRLEAVAEMWEKLKAELPGLLSGRVETVASASIAQYARILDANLRA